MTQNDNRLNKIHRSYEYTRNFHCLLVRNVQEQHQEDKREVTEGEQRIGIRYNVPYKSDTFHEAMFIAEPTGHFNGTIVFSCKKGVYSTRYEYGERGMQLISMMIKDGTYVEI